MSYAIVLDDIPKSLVIGNSVSWRKSLSDFPASAWTLTYAFVNSTGQFTITATAAGDDHLIEVAPATSSAYEAGEYDFQVFAEKSDNSERYKIGEGQVTVFADYEAETSGHDGRSFVKKSLDALEAVITNKITKDRATYAINGRSLSAYSWDEIYKLYADFKSLYAKERRAKQNRSSSVKVRFS